jgi:hypothetical protein
LILLLLCGTIPLPLQQHRANLTLPIPSCSFSFYFSRFSFHHHFLHSAVPRQDFFKKSAELFNQKSVGDAQGERGSCTKWQGAANSIGKADGPTKTHNDDIAAPNHNSIRNPLASIPSIAKRL